MQLRAKLARDRAMAWEHRLKLTDYENSAEARKEQALADIYDEIIEHNLQRKVLEEEGKDRDDEDLTA